MVKKNLNSKVCPQRAAEFPGKHFLFSEGCGAQEKMVVFALIIGKQDSIKILLRTNGYFCEFGR